MRKSRLAVCLIVLGIFASQIQCVCSFSTPDLSIPYEGWVGKWLRKTIIQGRVDKETTYLFKYNKELSPTLFEVKEISPESETYEMNITTREQISGPEKGNFTTHWVPSSLSVGDVIPLGHFDYMVMSKNEEVTTTLGNRLQCIMLETHFKLDEDTEIDARYWFDANTGIKIKMHSEPVRNGYYVEEMITDSGIDIDGDGLTDTAELLVTLTSPLKADTDGDGITDYSEDSDMDGVSDGQEFSRGTDPLEIDSDRDFWNDSLDLMPDNSLMPNGLVVFLVAVGIFGIVFYRFLRKRRHQLKSRTD